MPASSARAAVLAAVTLLGAGCSTAPMPGRGFAGACAEAPTDAPVRLTFRGDALVGAAVPLGPGGLPAPVRRVADAIQPGGVTTYAAREWGPRGEGYRVERRAGEGNSAEVRSLLVDGGGGVLERSHSVPIAQVPQAVLGCALQHGCRDVQRADIVSGPSTEECWRLLAADPLGRCFTIECSEDGTTLAVQRLLAAVAAVD